MPRQSFAVTPVKGRRDIGLVVDDIAVVDHLGGVKNGENAFGIVRARWWARLTRARGDGV